MLKVACRTLIQETDMKVSDEDLKIIKWEYSKKLSVLYRKFKEETGASYVDFTVQTINTDYAEDYSGNRCHGNIVAVSIDAYDDDEEEDDDDDY